MGRRKFQNRIIYLIREFANQHGDTPPSNLSPKEQVIWRISLGFIEINNSLEALRMIPFYLSGFKKTKSKEKYGLTEIANLRYHIEHYYQQMYILNERLKSFLKMIKKYARGDQQKVKKIERLAELIRHAFKGYLTVRGDHVHVKRYSDEDLTRLEVYNLTMMTADDFHIVESTDSKSIMFHIMAPYWYKNEYKRANKEWKDRIKTTHSKMGKMLDALFDQLEPIVFDKKGAISIGVPKRSST